MIEFQQVDNGVGSFCHSVCVSGSRGPLEVDIPGLYVLGRGSKMKGCTLLRVFYSDQLVFCSHHYQRERILAGYERDNISPAP